MTVSELVSEFESELKAHYEVCREADCKPEDVAVVTLEQALERLETTKV